MHEQVVTKVNALVDRDIAPVVEALNAFEGIITLDSYQRHAVTGEAYVYFTYGTGWRELGRFLEWLASQLRSLGLCCGYSLRLEWFGTNDQPRAQLAMSPQHVDSIAHAIRDSASTIHHTLLSTHGK